MLCLLELDKGGRGIELYLGKYNYLINSYNHIWSRHLGDRSIDHQVHSEINWIEP